jgi:hypothetical protein
VRGRSFVDVRQTDRAALDVQWQFSFICVGCDESKKVGLKGGRQAI